ncbi:hypothetical protein EVAR_19781_1 [Eumeta japonica]|uniref:Secreted protein n=1 Tax=Eumeta variegata TaxID=151549 RepID=A0A4C1UQZ2_EUMVA|nr:hypothetical protein EVAR_19781_1 [Eumeta japonica]
MSPAVKSLGPLIYSLGFLLFACRPEGGGGAPISPGADRLRPVLSAATELRNSVTKIKPNTPHSSYHVARPSVLLTCMHMVRLYEARTDRDELLLKSDEYVYSCL